MVIFGGMFDCISVVRELKECLVSVIFLPGFFTGLDVQPYKTMIDNLLMSFTDLSTKVKAFFIAHCDFSKREQLQFVNEEIYFFLLSDITGHNFLLKTNIMKA